VVEDDQCPALGRHPEQRTVIRVAAAVESGLAANEFVGVVEIDHEREHGTRPLLFMVYAVAVDAERLPVAIAAEAETAVQSRSRPDHALSILHAIGQEMANALEQPVGQARIIEHLPIVIPIRWRITRARGLETTVFGSLAQALGVSPVQCAGKEVNWLHTQVCIRYSLVIQPKNIDPTYPIDTDDRVAPLISPPGEPMARPSNTEERRAQIADGLLTVMAADGYERASIASIAAAAKLSPGLVHYHFKNKQDILLLAIERLRERVHERYQARLEKAGDTPLEQLFAFVDAHVALGDDADENAVAAWVAVGAEAVIQMRVREAYARVVQDMHATLKRSIAACLRHNGRSTRDAGRYAAAILAAIEGAYQLAATAPGAVPRGFAAPTFRRMLRGLLEVA
jgi:TetR/AcrR family transcriptional repressor of bet genes